MSCCLLAGVVHFTVGLLRVIITTKTLCFFFMLTTSRIDSIRALQYLVFIASCHLLVCNISMLGINVNECVLPRIASNKMLPRGVIKEVPLNMVHEVSLSVNTFEKYNLR